MFALTDVGCLRSLNEDNYGYYEGDIFSIYVVADGMGGHNAGEVASKIAVETVLNYFKNIDGPIDDYSELIKTSIVEANNKIYDLSKDNMELSGMGTTITMVLLDNDYAYFGNVGDSGGYKIFNGEMRKVTKDHSLIQELLDKGSITSAEAENHPNRNIITRAVGTTNELEVDVFKENKDYKYILLCSDGLTNELSMNEILTATKEDESNDLENICNNLVNLAKLKGGKDNITLLLISKED